MNWRSEPVNVTYHRPTCLEQALSLRAARDVVVLGGGTDIYPAQAGRDLRGEVLDLTAVDALAGITKTSDGWRIGATTRWSDVIAADLPAAFDVLKQAAGEVGSVQIQNSATVAGNLCNASPAADGVPPLLVLDAQVEIASERGGRVVPLAEFILNVRKTALAADEIVTAILVPDVAGCSAFSKLGARKYLVISIAMVAVRLKVSGGVIEQAAVCVGACSPVARRLEGFEAALVGLPVDDPTRWQAALRADIDDKLDPIDDIRADAGYRSGAVVDLVNRTIEMAIL
jgi:CO/xanthine dehydrogenase FAD-binding subunit